MTSGPQGGRKGRTKSFYLCKEAQEVLDSWGDNASEFVNRSILAAQGLNRNRLLAEIKRKTADKMRLEGDLSLISAEITSLQSQLAILDKTDDISKAKQERAREHFRKAFVERKRNEVAFRGFLTGPAGVKLLQEADFPTPNDCIQFFIDPKEVVQ
jgi:hypothetical protein